MCTYLCINYFFYEDLFVMCSFLIYYSCNFHNSFVLPMSKIDEEYYTSCNMLASGKATTWGSKVNVLSVHSGIRSEEVVHAS